jgi:ethanolamine ammonia-lyase small subunit
VGELVGAEVCVLLIGERPGLSSPDSLGVYVTYRPTIGRSDAERNCVSNIHDQGLSYELASQKILYLINEAQRLKLSGVELKERAGLLR